MALKLFVWEDVLRDYSPGIIFALANDAEEARRLVVETRYAASDTLYGEMGKPPDIYDEPVGFALWGGG